MFSQIRAEVPNFRQESSKDKFFYFLGYEMRTLKSAETLE